MRRSFKIIAVLIIMTFTFGFQDYQRNVNQVVQPQMGSWNGNNQPASPVRETGSAYPMAGYLWATVREISTLSRVRTNR